MAGFSGLLPATGTAAESIPFKHPVAVSEWGGATSLMIAALLLAAAFAVLFAIRRRGWPGAKREASDDAAASLQLKQRLRLSPTCQAYVLSQGAREVLIVESKFNVQIEPLTATLDESPEGRFAASTFDERNGP